MDGQNGVPDVIVLEVQGLELGLVHAPAEVGQGLLHVQADVLPFAAELGQDLQLLFLGGQTVENGVLFFQLFLALLKGLEFFGVVPDVGRRQFLVQGFDLGLDLSQVKENLGAVRT
jgi:hypothetical protein